MRTCVVLLLVAMLAAPAAAEVLMVHGTLSGDPMPEGYKFELAVLGVRENKPVLEVVGKSCTAAPEAVEPASCQRVTILFALPDGFSISNKKCYYQKGEQTLWLGNVAGLGATQWIQLRRGATIEATTTAARLKLDTAQLGSLTAVDQVQRFEELHSNE